MKTIKSRSAAACLLIILAFSSCGNQSEADKVKIADISGNILDIQQTCIVERKNIENCIWLPGYVAPKVYQLKFEEQGLFEAYKVNIGEEVSKGQELAVLSGTIPEEKEQEAGKQLEESTAEYEYQTAYIDKVIEAYKKEMEGYYVRLKDENNPLDSESYAAVCMELGIWEAAIKEQELMKTQRKEVYDLTSSYLRSQLSKNGSLSIKSPCDGIVIALQSIEKEAFTNEDYYYVAVVQKDVYYARCEYVAEAYAQGMSRITGFRNGKEYELNYIAIDPEQYVESKNRGEEIYTHFEILFPDEDIDYSDSLYVKMVLSEKENVLTIPAIAIDGDASGWFVYKQTEGGKEKVYVTTGLSNQVITEIKSGLEEGDVIYVPQ